MTFGLPINTRKSVKYSGQLTARNTSWKLASTKATEKKKKVIQSNNLGEENLAQSQMFKLLQ